MKDQTAENIMKHLCLISYITGLNIEDENELNTIEEILFVSLN